MLDIIFGWPDQFEQASFSTSERKAARLYRLQEFSASEAVLLSDPNFTFNHFFLLCLLYLNQYKYDAFLALKKQFPEFAQASAPAFVFLQSQFYLLKADIPKLLEIIDSVTSMRVDFWPLNLVLAALDLHLNNIERSKSWLDELNSDSAGSLECLRLKSRISEKQSLWSNSLDLLGFICNRFPTHLPTRIQYLDVVDKS